MSREMTETLTGLSHEFGTKDYVRGGGGNTSAKDADTLWVKPSGTTLAGMTPDSFVAMNRAAIDRLYDTEPPADPAGREALVKEVMQNAVLPESSGRPSVEAPLHNTFDATYVIHTHPAVVNGLTCSRDGAETCARMFPDALWMDQIDPGFTLCMAVREAILAWSDSHEGNQPAIVMLQNHGVFVAGNSPDDIRQSYSRLISRLSDAYASAGTSTELAVGETPPGLPIDELREIFRAATGEPEIHIAASPPFTVADGPLTPDHIVYHKAYPMTAELTADNIAAFVDRCGYWPRIVQTPDAVFAAGTTGKNAALALELARDGALTAQLAQAFGGAAFMSKPAADFIDNWEVEAYRRTIGSLPIP